CMLRVVDLCEGRENMFRPGAPEIRHELSIWIKEIADDLLKAGEVLLQIRREFRTRNEESRECPVLDGTRGLGVEAPFRERHDVFVAEDFEACFGKVFTQEPDRRKRQNKIADR